MNGFYLELALIREKPSMYQGEDSLELLHIFILGYICALSYNGQDTDRFLIQYHNYVLAHYRLEVAAQGWSNLLVEKTGNNKEAFQMFFILLDGYLMETTGRNLEENAHLE
ncbi:hypothetical protein [Listeria booriae]|uniref:hypothetical protein n=1 Tax=Listeria booriae TaxID=1552123 RepID=UPI0016280F28|nr:hypothetical protein [Listeria booriae]MBC2328416.1 hypothetical protein [Listeria booriae]